MQPLHPFRAVPYLDGSGSPREVLAAFKSAPLIAGTRVTRHLLRERTRTDEDLDGYWPVPLDEWQAVSDAIPDDDYEPRMRYVGGFVRDWLTARFKNPVRFPRST